MLNLIILICLNSTKWPSSTFFISCHARVLKKCLRTLKEVHVQRKRRLYKIQCMYIEILANKFLLFMKVVLRFK